MKGLLRHVSNSARYLTSLPVPAFRIEHVRSIVVPEVRQQPCPFCICWLAYLCGGCDRSQEYYIDVSVQILDRVSVFNLILYILNCWNTAYRSTFLMRLMKMGVNARKEAAAIFYFIMCCGAI